MVSVSSTKFPNNEFKRSGDFVKIIKKLYWSCKENITRFGFKRRLLSEAFPELCTYYDQYFYTNTQISRQIENENDDIIRFFTNEEEYRGFLGFSSLVEVNSLTKMPSKDFQQFKEIVMNYCRENLAKVVAFIPSPYVKKYVLDEV